MIPVLIGLTVALVWLALILTVLVPVLRDGRTPFVEPHKGKHVASQPRQGKQPWPTQGQPVLPPPPVPHAYDPGDGILPPVALVRPYAPAVGAWPCCEHCTDGSPCQPRDSHRTPCSDGCNDVNTNAGTLKLYERGNWGTMPEKQAAEAERLAKSVIS